MGEAKKIDPMTIAGMVLGGLGLAVGVYVAFIVAPEVAYLDGLDTKSDAQRAMWYDLLDKQINFGTAAMGLGGLGFLGTLRLRRLREFS